MPEVSEPESRLEDWLPSSLHTTVVNPTPETHVSILDDQAILLNLDTGAYHALNSVGTVIWENFTPDNTLANIQAILCNRYEVAEETAREDLLELVIRLYHMGLVTLDERS
jgi:hypothetical protein